MFTFIRKHPFAMAGSLLLILLVFFSVRPQPVLVETVMVKNAPMQVTIEEEGRTRIIDRYEISAPVSGVTCRQPLNVGDSVSKGDVLVSITPLESQVLDARARAQAEAQQRAARANMQAVEAQASAASATAELADDEVERLRPLLEKSLISTDDFERARTAALSAEAAERSALFQVETARYELEAVSSLLDNYSSNSAGNSSGAPLEQVNVLSPIDGRILNVNRRCEAPVNTGDVLVVIGDPRALEIEVDVLSADAVKIKPGMKVLFERWGGDKTLEGRVRVVEPVGFTKTSALGVEEQRVYIISDFVSPPEEWQSLGDGYRVDARFVIWEDEDVLQVPASSVFRYQDGWAVFVANNGKAQRRTIDTGRTNGLITEVLGAALQEGEYVINHPGDNITEGVRVKTVVLD